MLMSLTTRFFERDKMAPYVHAKPSPSMFALYESQTRLPLA